MSRRSSRTSPRTLTSSRCCVRCISKSNDHVQAHYALAIGHDPHGFPSVGSWVTYGLGSENQNLPAFVVIYDARGGPFGGPSNWSAGFMPAAYQGTVFRPSGAPILDLKPPAEITPEEQRARLDLLGKLNEHRSGEESGQLRTGRSHRVLRTGVPHAGLRAGSGRPQPESPRRRESCTAWMIRVTEPFGRQCLMARRLVERGVRFVQLYHGGLGNQNTDTWDAHEDVNSNHTQACAPKWICRFRGC